MTDEKKLPLLKRLGLTRNDVRDLAREHGIRHTDECRHAVQGQALFVCSCDFFTKIEAVAPPKHAGWDIAFDLERVSPPTWFRVFIGDGYDPVTGGRSARSPERAFISFVFDADGGVSVIVPVPAAMTDKHANAIEHAVNGKVGYRFALVTWRAAPHFFDIEFMHERPVSETLPSVCALVDGREGTIEFKSP